MNSVTPRMGLSWLAYPVRVFILKNGLYPAHADFLAGQECHKLNFTDAPTERRYYRVEVYACPAQSNFQNDFSGGREWQNTLALSNPAYVRGSS